MQRKNCNHEKIHLWDFDIFTLFQVSWIYLCYFCSDVYVYVCMCECMRVWWSTIASKQNIRLSSNSVFIIQKTVEWILLILSDVKFFFNGVQKRVLIQYDLRSQILPRVLVSKWCIQLSSNFVHILSVTILHIVPILVNLGLIVFLQENKKRLIHYRVWS